jgi:hypothetical protein
MSDLTPYSPSLGEIVKRWSTAGLVPVEISEADLIQTITVRHNAMTGKGEVQYSKLDGLQALAILADSMAAVWQDTFRSELRPPLNSGRAKVCLQLEDDRLSVSIGTDDPAHPEIMPSADPIIAKGMLAAVLFGLCEKTSNGQFDPMAALLQGLEFKLRKVNENGNG